MVTLSLISRCTTDMSEEQYRLDPQQALNQPCYGSATSCTPQPYPCRHIQLAVAASYSSLKQLAK